MAKRKSTGSNGGFPIGNKTATEYFKDVVRGGSSSKRPPKKSGGGGLF